MPDQETEITLGHGRLLGLFIGLVVLCGVFFVMGYMLGKNSAPGNTLLTDAAAGTSGDSAIKPGAIQQVATPTPAPAPVEQSSAEVSTPAPEPATAPAPEPVAEPAPETARPTARPTAPVAVSVGSYIVQVAAVSKQQDADALAAALRRKQYAVNVSSQMPDKLYHVQIGPFSDSKLAEMVRSRLVADGYNPIVKK